MLLHIFQLDGENLSQEQHQIAIDHHGFGGLEKLAGLELVWPKGVIVL